MGLRGPTYYSAPHDLVGSDAEGLLYDSAGVLRSVNANWNDDGWNVNANSISNPNRWNAGNQVFSRNCYLSSATQQKFSFGVLFSNRQAVDRFLRDLK